MNTLQALIWDVDGTLAETERDGHRVAFNRAFADLGLPWRWSPEVYRELLRISGGRERLLHDMRGRAEAPPTPGEREALARELHRRKNRHYAALVAEGGLTLRPGVAELLAEAQAEGCRLAIATTTSRANVQALLEGALGPGWARGFASVVCGEDVRHKKPDPEVYLRVLAELRLPPLACVALEDSPGGVAAARAAEVPVVVTRSEPFADAVIEGAIAIGPGLHTRGGWRPGLRPLAYDGREGGVTLADLQAWCREMDCVSQFG